MTEWTEDLIERRVEKMVDHLDAVFMAGKMSQADYDGAMRSLHQWTEARYREAAMKDERGRRVASIWPSGA